MQRILAVNSAGFCIAPREYRDPIGSRGHNPADLLVPTFCGNAGVKGSQLVPFPSLSVSLFCAVRNLPLSKINLSKIKSLVTPYTCKLGCLREDSAYPIA